jgi:hypothetical protein
MGNGVSHVNKIQGQIIVCILLMMDKNYMNKVITDRNIGAVKVMYIIVLCLH